MGQISLAYRQKTLYDTSVQCSDVRVEHSEQHIQVNESGTFKGVISSF